MFCGATSTYHTFTPIIKQQITATLTTVGVKINVRVVATFQHYFTGLKNISLFIPFCFWKGIQLHCGKMCMTLHEDSAAQ